eukprot:TRINITY_DN13697_c0_g2_i1.p3 TRINITY_DN13697_c0_g2~~TRINITY_DN13697_c0_g2_i1.p3  ORF type:complete len:153 (-),score=0.40 TRINITY_DN13697_c0_g2_i1:517-975(-)
MINLLMFSTISQGQGFENEQQMIVLNYLPQINSKYFLSVAYKIYNNYNLAIKVSKLLENLAKLAINSRKIFPCLHAKITYPTLRKSLSPNRPASQVLYKYQRYKFIQDFTSCLILFKSIPDVLCFQIFWIVFCIATGTRNLKQKSCLKARKF